MVMASLIEKIYSRKSYWYSCFLLFSLPHLYTNRSAFNHYTLTVLVTTSFFFLSAEQSYLSIEMKRTSYKKLLKVILISFALGVLIPFIQIKVIQTHFLLLLFSVYGVSFYIENMDSLGKELTLYLALILNGFGYIFVGLTLYCGFLNLLSIIQRKNAS